jgi:hypothetical protein
MIEGLNPIKEHCKHICKYHNDTPPKKLTCSYIKMYRKEKRKHHTHTVRMGRAEGKSVAAHSLAPMSLRLSIM